MTTNSFNILFEKLIGCMNEDEVTKVIENNAYTKVKANWIPLGNNQNNAAIVQNTAGTLGSCMAELHTNAMDATIQREKNKYEADNGAIPVEHLVNPQKALAFILGETYTNQAYREEYANDHIRIITTEIDEGKRNLTMLDRGCGQKAENFGATFCSVGSGFQNKAHKPYLHGNYGQGSTSANAISGKRGYKIIVSREDESQKWAFTVVRRMPSDPSVLEYLIVDNGKSVPEFDVDALELGYRVTGEVEKGEGNLTYGSAIKLFNVNFDKGFVGIKKTLSSVLFRPALPLKSIEFSNSNEKNKSSGRDTRWIFGLGAELEKALKNGVATLHQTVIGLPHLGGNAYMNMYFIRNEEDKKKMLDWLPSGYGERHKRVFHINNGQVQHTDTIHRLGKFFPKAKENVFIEIDLSNIDQSLAKAYFWKADRTSCQMSSEYFIEYDNILNNYIKDNDVLQEWERICKNDELASLKLINVSTQDDHTRELLNICGLNSRESQQHKSIKKLIQTEHNMPSTYARGKLSLVDHDEKDVIEVEGKEVPTEFSNVNSTKKEVKKSSSKKLNTTFKTDLKKGSIGTKDSNSNVVIKKAVINEGEENESILDVNKVNLFATQNKDGSIKCEFSASEDIKKQMKDGDIVTIKLELSTNHNGNTTILESTVYFEIVEEVEIVKVKKTPRIDADIIFKSYGTRDGRQYNGVDTATLPSDPEKFSMDSGFYVVSQNDKINVIINLDNKQFDFKTYTMKPEDKARFIENWESYLFIQVVEHYKDWNNSDKSQSLEDKLDEINKMGVMMNKIAITSATYNDSQNDKTLNNVTKHLDKVSKAA